MQKNTTIAQTTVNSTKSTKRILIVGGGYVGFYAYKAIMKKAKHLVRSGAVSITVVDPLSSHSFHGFSGETVGGIISEDARRSPFRKIFADARFIRGYATNINEIEKRVEVRTTDGESTTSLGYDHLILGVGVGDDLDSVPGIREHGLTLRGSGGPDGLRATVLERLEQATVTSNPDLREKLLSFVVAGGGFTGVEIAAAIAELLKAVAKEYPILAETSARVSLVHAGDRILPDLVDFPKLADYATEQLLEAGISIRCGMKVANVSSFGAHLDDGSLLPSASVISTVGTSVRAIPGGELWDRDRSGRLVADRTLRLDGSSTIWIGGDGARIEGRNGGTNAPNALWAIKHGEHIGGNIVRELTGRRLVPFSYPGLGQAASLGLGRGIVEFKGLQFTGLVAWVMRIGFFLYFLPSRRTAVQALVEWLSLPITGRRLDVPRRSNRPRMTRPTIANFGAVGILSNRN